MRILVVDDEPPIAALCLKILERLGHEVEAVTRGEEALSKLAGAPVDLLIVDYKMPGWSGFEMVRQARSLHPGLKVVLMTGQGTREVMDEAVAGGINGVLAKPFTPDELASTVNAALE